MAQIYLTPTLVSGWLECDHSLSLRLSGEGRDSGGGKFAELVREKGDLHEHSCLEALESEHGKALDLSDLSKYLGSDPEGVANEARRLLLNTDRNVVFQMPFVHGSMRGIADFLVRTADTQPGYCEWEPVDSKLSRSEAKTGHVLQLSFYAQALETVAGLPPEWMRIWLGSGEDLRLRTVDFAPYWRRIRGELEPLLASGEPSRLTKPEPCNFCTFCDFENLCKEKWRREDSLVNVANIIPSERRALEAMGIETIQGLADATTMDEDSSSGRLVRRRQQARLQKLRTSEDEPPPFTRIDPDPDDPKSRWGRGLQELPEPDDADVFFDVEGDPVRWIGQDLVFLFGILEHDEAGGRYLEGGLWAHTIEEQLAQACWIIDYFSDRRSKHPGMHVYHYNHTERTVLERIVSGTGHESRLAELVDSGLFVDLYGVMTNAFQVGVERYGLKHVEALAGFKRAEGIEEGAGAVIEYEEYLKDGDDGRLNLIARYNEDDVRATAALRDWIVAQHTEDDVWREAFTTPDDDSSLSEPDDLIDDLAKFPKGSVEHQLSELLGYWSREKRASNIRLKQIVGPEADPESQMSNPAIVAALEATSISTTDEGLLNASFRFPSQDCEDVGKKAKVLVDGKLRSVKGLQVDRDALSVAFSVEPVEGEPGAIGSAIVNDDWVSATKLEQALQAVATAVLGQPSEVGSALAREILSRAPSKFGGGGRPSERGDTPKLDGIIQDVLALDSSYFIIQGPPGTGKTFTGAEIALALARENKTVGISARSHKTIEGFLLEVSKPKHHRDGYEEITWARYQDKVNDPENVVPAFDSQAKLIGKKNRGPYYPHFSMIGGAPRFFCSDRAQSMCFDYIIIDEAGQMPLAEVLAMSAAAKNVVFLGDPQQLPQVSQATNHPGESGLSALGYLIGKESSLVDPIRGALLDISYRMHPDICTYVSETFYEGALNSEPTCNLIELDGIGTGTEWHPVEHEANSTSSIEECMAIRRIIIELLGTSFVNSRGEARRLVGEPKASGSDDEDFMVLVPYNAQKRLMRKILSEDERTSGLSACVGTVDKFQGREAAVVIYSLTSSSRDDSPRDSSFLFSRERLNVAVSRAQGRMYLVGSSALLASHARTVEEMRMFASLDALIEHSTQLGH